MKLYLAGPMTGWPNFNYDMFRVESRRLEEAGYEVESPLQEGDEEIQHSVSYEYFLRRGFQQLLDCDGLAYMEPVGLSKGATRELTLAQWIKIPAYPVSVWLELRAEGYPCGACTAVDLADGGIIFYPCGGHLR